MAYFKGMVTCQGNSRLCTLHSTRTAMGINKDFLQICLLYLEIIHAHQKCYFYLRLHMPEELQTIRYALDFHRERLVNVNVF